MKNTLNLLHRIDSLLDQRHTLQIFAIDGCLGGVPISSDEFRNLIIVAGDSPCHSMDYSEAISPQRQITITVIITEKFVLQSINEDELLETCALEKQTEDEIEGNEVIYTLLFSK